jgi:hypothetical protein
MVRGMKSRASIEEELKPQLARSTCDCATFFTPAAPDSFRVHPIYLDHQRRLFSFSLLLHLIASSPHTQQRSRHFLISTLTATHSDTLTATHSQRHAQCFLTSPLLPIASYRLVCLLCQTSAPLVVSLRLQPATATGAGEIPTNDTKLSSTNLSTAWPLADRPLSSNTSGS